MSRDLVWEREVDTTTVSKVLHEQGHNEAQMSAVGRCPGWPDLRHLNCSIRIRIRMYY